MSHLTMQQLEDLGFVIDKSFNTLGLIIQRRKRGNAVIETLWNEPTGNFIKQRLIIDGVTKEQILKLINE